MRIREPAPSIPAPPPTGPSPPRRMRPSDLGQVAKIEAETFLGPWPAAYFLECLQAGHECWVLEKEGSIEAYSVMSVARGVAHLLNLCVHPALRGQGLGRRLLGHMIAAAEPKARSMILEVRASNQTALGLYSSMQFQEIGLRRRYYPSPEGREDALVLFRSLRR